jgi:hypothetical protein
VLAAEASKHPILPHPAGARHRALLTVAPQQSNRERACIAN